MAVDCRDVSSPPAGCAADWTVPQRWGSYSDGEHATWLTLYERQMAVLQGRACPEFLAGLQALDLHGNGIPDFDKLNARLSAITGWQVVAVPGLVPESVFFDHLAQRRFPAGRFIRRPDQLDYLQEPDIFHDVFGHVPMLCDPVFADYMVEYGRGGQRAAGLGQLEQLARLYWYTVEFGLLQTPEGLRICGAGIVSSATESVFALESASPNRIAFDLERVMRTRYRIDDFQQTYFVIPSLEELRRATLQDFAPIYARLAGQPTVPMDELLPTDHVLTRGDQSHARLASAAAG
jgi:phenylalanine-4-hydroxylase